MRREDLAFFEYSSLMRPARKLGKLEETKNKYKNKTEIERKEEGSPLKQCVGLI